MAVRIFKILIISLLLLQAVFVFAEEDKTDIAAVNGTIIKSSAVRREMNMMYQRAVSQGVYPDDSEINAYWLQSLESLIGRELLFQDAIANDYKADTEAVEEYIAALTVNYGGIEQLETALEAQGMDLETLRTDTLRYYVISSYVDMELSQGLEVSDDESLAYYTGNPEYFVQEETVRASHILLTTAEGADEAELNAALEEITGLRGRIAAGEDFAELAIEFSDCPSSEQGGDLGVFGHGQMVPPFDRAAFALDVGELSEPVQTQFGYHLIKLTEKHSGEKMAFDDVKGQIAEHLKNLALEQLVTEHVAVLRDSAEIKLF